MNWSFRYEGSPDDLESALEKHRKTAKLLPDDRAQFETVATMLLSELVRVPQKASVLTICVRGDDQHETGAAPGESGPKMVRRSLFVDVSAR